MKAIIITLILIGLILGFSSCKKNEDPPLNDNYVQKHNSIIDPRDNHVYVFDTFGTQIWLVENLRHRTFSSYTNYDKWDTKHGEYYNWAAVMDIRSDFNYLQLYGNHLKEPHQGVCPPGWHIPSDTEWNTLEMTLGMAIADTGQTEYRGIHGASMKSITEWQGGGNGTNSSGFNALPSGFFYRAMAIQVRDPGRQAYFWSVSEYDRDSAWVRGLNFDRLGVSRQLFDKTLGASCRCLKD